MSLTKWLIWGRNTKSKRIKGFINWFIRRYYACEINCDTRIDESVKFPHGGLGVMINTHCIIGKNVSIFPGAKLVVTKGKCNAPIIEDNVIIGANATLVGRINVGETVRKLR